MPGAGRPATHGADGGPAVAGPSVGKEVAGAAEGGGLPHRRPAVCRTGPVRQSVRRLRGRELLQRGAWPAETGGAPPCTVVAPTPTADCPWPWCGSSCRATSAEELSSCAKRHRCSCEVASWSTTVSCVPCTPIRVLWACSRVTAISSRGPRVSDAGHWAPSARRRSLACAAGATAGGAAADAADDAASAASSSSTTRWR